MVRAALAVATLRVGEWTLPLAPSTHEQAGAASVSVPRRPALSARCRGEARTVVLLGTACGGGLTAGSPAHVYHDDPLRRLGVLT
jgi:hypothetical protein